MLFFEKLELDRPKNDINLLYIDDDPFIQKIIASWFEKISEVHLDICGSVEELQQYLDNTYDIIVSDNMLKDGNIHDVLASIKTSGLSNTPLMVYTGTIDKLNLDDLQKVGNVIDVLPKPFEMKTFMKKVEMIKKLKG